MMYWRDGQNAAGATYLTESGNIRSISVTANAGSVDLKGIEFEFDALLTEKLSLNGSLSYADPVYKNYQERQLGPRLNGKSDVSGNQLYQVPKWTWHLSPQWEDRLVGDWDYFVRADYRYRSRLYIDTANVAWIKGRHLVDLRAGVSNGPFSLDFYVRNLLNDKKLPEGLHKNDIAYQPSMACPPCYTDANPPIFATGALLNEIRLGLPQLRTFGLKASYNF